MARGHEAKRRGAREQTTRKDTEGRGPLTLTSSPPPSWGRARVLGRDIFAGCGEVWPVQDGCRNRGWALMGADRESEMRDHEQAELEKLYLCDGGPRTQDCGLAALGCGHGPR